MLFVTGQERSRRLAICEACKYFKQETKSCGTILRPRNLKNGVYLCGCHMPTKTRFKLASCGAGKWDEQMTQEELDQLKKVVEMKGNVSAEQICEMIDTYNTVTGSNEKYTTCTACLKQLQDKMRRMVEHDHEKEVKEKTNFIAARKKSR